MKNLDLQVNMKRYYGKPLTEEQKQEAYVILERLVKQGIKIQPGWYPRNKAIKMVEAKKAKNT